MTPEEIRNCVVAAQKWTRNKELLYKEHQAEYSSYSAREVFRILGLDKSQQDEVLTAIYEGGFTHCLDPMFPSMIEGSAQKTPYFACVWGIDQLRSRLDCV